MCPLMFTVGRHFVQSRNHCTTVAGLEERRDRLKSLSSAGSYFRFRLCRYFRAGLAVWACTQAGFRLCKAAGRYQEQLNSWNQDNRPAVLGIVGMGKVAQTRLQRQKTVTFSSYSIFLIIYFI